MNLKRKYSCENRKPRHIAVSAAVCLAVVLIGSCAFGSSPKDSVDGHADRLKARHLVETGGSLIGENILMATRLYEEAQRLDAGDTVVQMAVNDVKLTLRPTDNALYYPQLELLETRANVPMRYYYTLSHASPDDHGRDSLYFFTTAVKAYERFPEQEIFIDNLLGTGVAYVYGKRYKTNAMGAITDTLDLSYGDLALAENLLNWADTIENRAGYSNVVDRARSAIYSMLERKDDIERLSAELEQRDSTDIPTLDLLTSLALVIGDSVRVSELGIKRFSLDPSPDHVYSLYDAVQNDSLRKRFVDQVFKTVSDTDREPRLRLDLLSALAQAYYDNLDSLQETPLPSRISSAVRDITAEDPSDLAPYLQGVLLVRNNLWVKNHGYSHLIDAVEAIPDTTGALQAVSTVIVSNVGENKRFEDSLQKIWDFHKVNDREFELMSRLTMAQYLFNTEQYERALSVLGDITLDDIRKDEELQKESAKNRGGEDDSGFEDEEDMGLKRWIAIQTLISECQMKLELVDDALSTLQGIIAIDPENAEALNNLAFYMCENGRDLSIALSLVDRSLAIDPENMNALDTRAWINFRRGEIADAVTYMSKFFMAAGLDLFNDILASEDPEASMEKKLNIERTVPIIAHLVAILATSDDADMAAVWRLVDIVDKYEPDNPDLEEFLSKHSRP